MKYFVRQTSSSVDIKKIFTIFNDTSENVYTFVESVFSTCDCFTFSLCFNYLFDSLESGVASVENVICSKLSDSVLFSVFIQWLQFCENKIKLKISWKMFGDSFISMNTYRIWKIKDQNIFIEIVGNYNKYYHNVTKTNFHIFSLSIFWTDKNIYTTWSEDLVTEFQWFVGEWRKSMPINTEHIFRSTSTEYISGLIKIAFY